MFDLRRPCAQCPFRSDIRPYLRPGRIEEIAEATAFHCHKTVDYSNDGDGDVVPDSQLCAGWLIVQEKEGRPAQTLQVMQRLGFYHPERLDMAAPVYESFEAMHTATVKADP